MCHKDVSLMVAGSLALLAAVATVADESVTYRGGEVDVRQAIDPGPQRDADDGVGEDVQDLSDGGTNDGGVPEVVVNPMEAALDDEQNMGPNAPGYIPSAR